MLVHQIDFQFEWNEGFNLRKFLENGNEDILKFLQTIVEFMVAQKRTRREHELLEMAFKLKKWLQFDAQAYRASRKFALIRYFDSN